MRARAPRFTPESPLNRLNGSITVPSPTRNLPQPMTRLGPMIASSEMSFPSLRSAHVFSDEVGSSHAKSDNQRFGRLLDVITMCAFVERDEWPLSWWWPLDTC